MTPERWEQVEKLFNAAVEKSAEERNFFLDEACGNDAELKREVESLLAQAESVSSPIAAAVSEAAESFSILENRIGKHIGPYRIVAVVGQGGMGTVYKAVRDDDQFSKQVAIKIVKRGMDVDPVIHRFRQERQILAALEHPNIARLLDGGTTEDGLPYFVMEYIDGSNILQYCRNKQLSVSQRLKVFHDICMGVQHAHQRLIIHRDIKPANILVDADGVPKLLDFGIAKLLSPDASMEMPTATMTILRFMTPDYASPEQVRGMPISTATDVYSLGAVLYQLLTGQRPHNLKNYTPTEIERAICVEKTEKPSVASTRSPNVPARLPRILAGDLDNIVLMAMRKEPERRYQSAGQLAEDINRYLRKLPVIAQRDTFTYRAGKFARRHKLALMAAMLVVLSLTGGIVAALHQAHKAERRFQEVRKLANTFLFEFYETIRNLPGSTDAREMIVRTALEYLDRLSKEAPGDPSLKWELAEAYQKVADIQGDPRAGNLGHPEKALESYSKSLALIRELRDEEADNLRVLRSLATCLYKVGDLKVEMGNIRGGTETLRDAVAASEEAYALKTGTRDDSLLLIRAERLLADAILKSRNPVEALAIERRALVLSEQMVHDFPDDFSRHHLALTLIRVGEAQIETGDLPAGIATYKKALEIRTDLIKRNPADPYMRREWRLLNIWLGNHYGGMDTFNLGDRQTAEEYYRKALSIAEELAAEDPKNAAFQHDLSICYAKVGQILSESKPDEAVLYIEKAVTINEKLLAASPREFRFLSRKALYGRYIALPLRKLGNHKKAIEQLQTSIDVLNVMLKESPTNPEAISGFHDAVLSLADTQLESGDFESAQTNYQHALAMSEEEVKTSPADLYAKWRLADSYAGLGRLYGTMAMNSSDSSEQRIEHWRQARNWFAQSHSIWKNWGRTAVSTAFDANQATRAIQNLSRCDAAIAELQLPASAK
jgi:serine/threonine protein kinase